MPKAREICQSSASRLLRRVSFCFEDGFVAVSEGEFDLDGPVVEQFGGSFALDLVACLASRPSAIAKSMLRAYSTSRPRSKAPNATSPRLRRRSRTAIVRAAQIEIELGSSAIGPRRHPPAGRSVGSRLGPSRAGLQKLRGSRARLLGGGTAKVHGASDGGSRRRSSRFAPGRDRSRDPADGRSVDPLAAALARTRMAGVSRRAAVDRRRSAVRRSAPRDGVAIIERSSRPQVLGVVGLVGAERDRRRPIGARLDHGRRCDPLGMAVGLGQTGVDDEAVAVLHQRIVP